MAKSEVAITKKTTVTVGLVIVMCLSCLWVGGTYHSFGNRLENLEQVIKGHLDKQAELTIALNASRAEHRAITAAMEQKTRDRWAKANDLAFMREFSRVNELQMVVHERIFGFIGELP